MLIHLTPNLPKQAHDVNFLSNSNLNDQLSVVYYQSIVDLDNPKAKELLEAREEGLEAVLKKMDLPHDKHSRLSLVVHLAHSGKFLFNDVEPSFSEAYAKLIDEVFYIDVMLCRYKEEYKRRLNEEIGEVPRNSMKYWTSSEKELEATLLETSEELHKGKRLLTRVQINFMRRLGDLGNFVTLIPQLPTYNFLEDHNKILADNIIENHELFSKDENGDVYVDAKNLRVIKILDTERQQGSKP